MRIIVVFHSDQLNFKQEVPVLASNIVRISRGVVGNTVKNVVSFVVVAPVNSVIF